MHHTVYFGHKPLFLATNLQNNLVTRYGPAKVYNAPFEAPGSLLKAIEQLGTPNVAAAVLYHSNLNELLDALKEHFLFIQAAGGLVQSDNGNLLLIYRKGKWDLPKGKLDEGETLEECAVREVSEETGLEGLQLIRSLGTTYHTYVQDGEPVLKESHWYLMQAPESRNLQPQTEEDIEQCIWAEPAQLESYLTNTHPSIADVLCSVYPRHPKGQ